MLTLYSQALSISKVEFLEEIPDGFVSSYAVLRVPLQALMKDVSLLCLGSSGNLSLAFEVGYAIGTELRDLGVNALVFGCLDTLDGSDEDPLSRVSSSPYITVRVLEYLAYGLSSAGVVPVIDGSGSIDLETVKALKSRGLYLPVYIDEPFKADILVSMGYDTVFFDGKTFLNSKPPVFKWRGDRKVDFEKLRREVLSRSIVVMNPNSSGIAVNDPFSNSKVLIFSNEDWLLKLAKEVEAGKKPPTGRKTW